MVDIFGKSAEVTLGRAEIRRARNRTRILHRDACQQHAVAFDDSIEDLSQLFVREPP